MTAFAIIAAVLTILAVAVVAWPLLRGGTEAQPVAATVTAIGIPAAVFVVYLLVSNHDWRATPSAPAGPAPASMASASVEEAVASLERKLAENPANEEGWILLGSSYLSLDRPADGWFHGFLGGLIGFIGLGSAAPRLGARRAARLIRR